MGPRICLEALLYGERRIVEVKDISYIPFRESLVDFFEVRCTFSSDPRKVRWLLSYTTVDCCASSSRQFLARVGRGQRCLNGTVYSCVGAHLDHRSSDASLSFELRCCSTRPSFEPTDMCEHLSTTVAMTHNHHLNGLILYSSLQISH